MTLHNLNSALEKSDLALATKIVVNELLVLKSSKVISSEESLQLLRVTLLEIASGISDGLILRIFRDLHNDHRLTLPESLSNWTAARILDRQLPQQESINFEKPIWEQCETLIFLILATLRSSSLPNNFEIEIENISNEIFEEDALYLEYCLDVVTVIYEEFSMIFLNMSNLDHQIKVLTQVTNSIDNKNNIFKTLKFPKEVSNEIQRHVPLFSFRYLNNRLSNLVSNNHSIDGETLQIIPSTSLSDETYLPRFSRGAAKEIGILKKLRFEMDLVEKLVFDGSITTAMGVLDNSAASFATETLDDWRFLIELCTRLMDEWPTIDSKIWPSTDTQPDLVVAFKALSKSASITEVRSALEIFFGTSSENIIFFFNISSKNVYDLEDLIKANLTNIITPTITNLVQLLALIRIGEACDRRLAVRCVRLLRGTLGVNLSRIDSSYLRNLYSVEYESLDHLGRDREAALASAEVLEISREDEAQKFVSLPVIINNLIRSVSNMNDLANFGEYFSVNDLYQIVDAFETPSSQEELKSRVLRLAVESAAAMNDADIVKPLNMRFKGIVEELELLDVKFRGYFVPEIRLLGSVLRSSKYMDLERILWSLANGFDMNRSDLGSVRLDQFDEFSYFNSNGSA